MNKYLARMAMFLALAAIMGYLEALIPIPFGIPGIKLGLANFIIVLVMYLFRIRDAVIISILRIILVGFMFSNLSMIMYSLAGAVFSLLIMALLKRYSGASVYFISAAGGVMHNIGQLAVASVLVGLKAIIWYLPVLVISGLITGLLIGALVSISCQRLSKLKDHDG